MSRIIITIVTERVSVTETFDEKKLGSVTKTLTAALKWLAVGTEYEIKENKKDAPIS